MNHRICPITYECIDDTQSYSEKGLKQLSPELSSLEKLPYSSEELINEAAKVANKLSIGGVQPKLSAQLDTKKQCFVLVSQKGTFILKPPHPIYPHLPENEDLTMRLAKQVNIDIPFHGLIWSKDNKLTYFIRRFDRLPGGKKIRVEDFAQVAELDRENKYNYSMEKVIKIIDTYCSVPAIEKLKLFKIVLFNFLSGNEDMHLKNYSLIEKNGMISLSPSYDLLNTSIVLNTKEEIALPLNGKKHNLRQHDLIQYYAEERLQLSHKSIEQTLTLFQSALGKWEKLIGISFLSDEEKQRYTRFIQQKAQRLQLI